MRIEDVISFHTWRAHFVDRKPLVHVIGIAGVAMAPLALLLRDYGCEVQGSDKDFYPPTSDMLAEAKLQLYKGFSADSLTNKPDLVVVGNVARRDNPEVLETVAKKIPYTIFPKLLDELVIKHEDSVVVTGTHGKTTVTGLLINAAKNLDMDPSYFIGGRLVGGPSLCASSGKISIVEGDEYDSAFFAKVPKFHFYGASKLLINALDFDHADIYENKDAIIKVFEAKLETLCLRDATETMPAPEVVVCVESQELASLVTAWEKRFKGVKFVTYASRQAAHNACFEILDRQYRDGFQHISIAEREGDTNFVLTTRLQGKFNALNVLAAYLAMRHKVSGADFSKAIAEFTGVLRRQTVLFDDGDNLVIEDFAHHPVEVSCLLEAMRECHPNKRLIALFEPRSNSSRRNLFFKDYVASLSIADEIFIKRVPEEAGIEALRTDEIVQELARLGRVATAIDRGQDIIARFKEDKPSNAVILVMSNGSFDRIYASLRSLGDYANKPAPGP